MSKLSLRWRTFKSFLRWRMFIFERWKQKRKRPPPGYYYKSSIIKSFFRFLKIQPELKKLVIIPLCLIIFLLLITMFKAPSNSLIQNLFTTFIGILIIVTFISFIQYRENQKRFFPIYHKIIDDLIDSCHCFITSLFEKFLAPLSSEDEDKYYKANNEPDSLKFSYINYLRNSDLFLKLAEDISIKKIRDTEEIHSAKKFLDAKEHLIDNLNKIKCDYISILDLMVINEIEKIKHHQYRRYETEKPETDERHHYAWGHSLIEDIQSTLIDCFNFLEVLKQWDQDLDKTFFDSN